MHDPRHMHRSDLTEAHKALEVSDEVLDALEKGHPDPNPRLLTSPPFALDFCASRISDSPGLVTTKP